MADNKKVLYQSKVHGAIDYEPLTKKYARAIRQAVDTVAPGTNPRRRKARLDKAEDAAR